MTIGHRNQKRCLGCVRLRSPNKSPAKYRRPGKCRDCGTKIIITFYKVRCPACQRLHRRRYNRLYRQTNKAKINLQTQQYRHNNATARAKHVASANRRRKLIAADPKLQAELRQYQNDWSRRRRKVLKGLLVDPARIVELILKGGP
jgi:hypothetical protein